MWSDHYVWGVVITYGEWSLFMGSGHYLWGVHGHYLWQVVIIYGGKVGKKGRGQAKVAGFLFGTAVGCHLRS